MKKITSLLSAFLAIMFISAQISHAVPPDKSDQAVIQPASDATSLVAQQTCDDNVLNQAATMSAAKTILPGGAVTTAELKEAGNIYPKFNLTVIQPEPATAVPGIVQATTQKEIYTQQPQKVAGVYIGNKIAQNSDLLVKTETKPSIKTKIQAGGTEAGDIAVARK